MRITLLMALLSIPLTAGAEPAKYSLLTPDYPELIQESDIIVVGKVIPYESELDVIDRQCFQIQVQEVLKPAIAVAAEEVKTLTGVPLPAELKKTPLVLVLFQGVQSSLGTIPKLETNKNYLFFLKGEIDEVVSTTSLSFSPVKLWQGSVPLEPAAEMRILAGTLDGYEVDILKNPTAFIKAIGLATGSTPQAAADKEAVEIARKLGLQPAAQ